MFEPNFRVWYTALVSVRPTALFAFKNTVIAILSPITIKPPSLLSHPFRTLKIKKGPQGVNRVFMVDIIKDGTSRMKVFPRGVNMKMWVIAIE